MSTTYLTDNKEIVFLNNHNIAQERDDDIQYNAIPSLSLVNKLYDNIALSASNVSTELESLSAVDQYLSSEISSTVTFVYKTGTGTATTNKLSVIEVTNDEYNNLASHSMLDPKAMYVIEDNFIDAKGRPLSNLADPTASGDATNKNYVDTVSSNTLDAAKLYANSLSTSLSTTVPVELATAIESLSTSLSGTVDAKRKKAIEDLSTSLSTTVVNSNYAVYSSLGFTYDTTTHYLSVEISNINGTKTVKAIDANEFVKNKIIDHMKVKDGYLVIYWSNDEDIDKAVSIPLSELAQVYDPGTGITITQADAFTIAVDFDEVAKKSDVTTLSGTVRTLSSTIIPGIAETVNTLSSSTIPNIEGNVSELSTELTAITDSSKFAGKFVALSTNVQTLSNSMTNEFLLSAEAVDAIRSTLVTEINANNSQITANADNIAKLQAYADRLSTDTIGIIPVLTTKADNAILSASNAKAAVNDLLAPTGPIAEIQTSMASIDSRIQGLSTLTNSHTATLLGHNYNIEQNATNITELSGSARVWDTTLSNNLVEYTNGRITSLSTTVNTISNLLSTDIETLSVNLSTDLGALSANLSTDLGALSTNLSTDLSATKKLIAESLATLEEGMTIDDVIGMLIELRDSIMEE